MIQLDCCWSGMCAKLGTCWWALPEFAFPALSLSKPLLPSAAQLAEHLASIGGAPAAADGTFTPQPTTPLAAQFAALLQATVYRLPCLL